MPRGAARAQRATRQLFWLLFVSAAAALTPQEQELFNRRLDQLYGSKLVRKAATGQAVVFTGPDSGPTELETEHYGRLHAKHPVRHCCAAEECAAANARVAFVASLRRCVAGPGSAGPPVHPEHQRARSCVCLVPTLLKALHGPWQPETGKCARWQTW